MSTVCSNLLKSKIGKINTEKTINIICKDFEGNIVFVNSIKYDKSIIRPKDIKEIIEKDKDIKFDNYFIDYDNTTKAKYIVSKAEKHKRIINWDIDFDNVSISDMFDTTNSNNVNIILVEVIGEMGGAFGEICRGIVIELLKKAFKKFINIIKIKYNPYKVFMKSLEFYLDESFIKRVILMRSSWPAGFITNKNIENKELIEKEIMKKLGYEKRANKWIEKEHDYKYPHEFLD